MSRPATPEPRGPAGFTLLECVVATLVLTLLITGMAALTVAHDRLLQGLGTWAHGDPVLFVVPPRDTLALIGAPAQVSPDPPSLPAPTPPGPLSVTVLEVTQGLQPAFVAALAHVEDS